ncbi:MAG: aspartyl-tRNA amidotransferase [Candidatus Magasanikbacteria bacterium CG_4_9_14_0_2_um_filter_41_10]|uniref:Aspartyl-tRNA amidotransferase n=1 Tax=Candidatus Magasanikbacteria bacterium CG_4_10_14_0_2_um_filter_41_31 TaxID=1974639 RepID=A0A2M7V3I3_9BACT|nr:MAG: hypothetical protein AUJ37_01550 [Candidatus Magasanikbacteria bacterium CG1_02_41_34]PIZ93049.1 MAG: aspartyl-tRNA amidotransferase [Candidatus Magasanikbacteria bacterium CG_4_10_14_0_2_um_filter_41_31]PJC53796.1 MAG: aspartyl-tRNA amidotransferase [Candidatus Magasanikbacteria bacterium CG_4_9_14_0_2_um_filter_41_10]
MTFQENIHADMVVAMKAKNSEHVRVLRNAIAAIKNTMIEKGEAFTDDDALASVAAQVKQLKDAIIDFQAGGRDDLVAQNMADIGILETYLPEQLADEALEKIVAETLSEIGVTTPQDIGKAMGAVMKKVQGQADGTRVKTVVIKLLQ